MQAHKYDSSRFLMLRGMVKDGVVGMKVILSEEQVVDFFTKKMFEKLYAKYNECCAHPWRVLVWCVPHPSAHVA